jgi:hypothetical protein
MEADERRRVTVGEPDMSRKATPNSSDETAAGESSCMRELTMRRQTDTPDLMNPKEEHDRKESETEPRLDEVELGIGMDFREVDEHGEPLVLTRPKPHGLIPVPSEVETIVAREEARLLEEHGMIPTAEARQRMVDSLTLQYYFDGIDIAYRRTPRASKWSRSGSRRWGS